MVVKPCKVYLVFIGIVAFLSLDRDPFFSAVSVYHLCPATFRPCFGSFPFWLCAYGWLCCSCPLLCPAGSLSHSFGLLVRFSIVLLPLLVMKAVISGWVLYSLLVSTHQLQRSVVRFIRLRLGVLLDRVQTDFRRFW